MISSQHYRKSADVYKRQVLAGGDKYIDREKVLEYVGTTGEEFFIDLTELVSLRKSAKALLLLNDVLTEGKDVKQIMKDWVSHYRSLLITKFVDDAEDMLNMSAENLKRVSDCLLYTSRRSLPNLRY